jgi:oligoribonuclease NrnB/cAMP/cGMP phosphodiesterase (DHH superfamily)
VVEATPEAPPAEAESEPKPEDAPTPTVDIESTTETAESSDVPPPEESDKEPSEPSESPEPTDDKPDDKESEKPEEPEEPAPEEVKPDKADDESKDDTEPESGAKDDKDELPADKLEQEPETTGDAKESVEPPSPEGTVADAEFTEDETTDLEDTEEKKINYDFFPTRDTITIIANSSVDGLLSVSAIMKQIGPVEDTTSEEDSKKVRVFFTPQQKTFSSLAKSIPDLNKLEGDDFTIGQLYICDLPLHRSTLLGSTIYDKVKWFDHHEVDPSEQYDSDIENIEIIIDPSAESTTSIVCQNLKIQGDFPKIAEEINSNKIESPLALRLHQLVGAYHHRYSGVRLKIEMYELAQLISQELETINQETNDPLIEEYNKWLDEFNKFIDENFQFKDINGHKVGILASENTAPVYSIYENLKTHPEAPFDVIAVLINKYYRLGKDKNNKFKSKRYTKLELRTHTDTDIIDIAKLMGGGGHKYASGSIIHDGLEKENLIKTLESYFTGSDEKDQIQTQTEKEG